MKNLLFVILLSYVSSSYGFECPYAVGEGRILGYEEEKAFLNRLESSGDKETWEWFSSIYARYKSELRDESKASLKGITVIEFYDIYQKFIKEGSKEGEKIFLICFDCHESFPSKGIRKASLDKSAVREFWVLSGYSISVGISKDRWRVLYHGAAE